MPQKQTVLDTTKSLKQEMPQKTNSSGYNQITQTRNASETTVLDTTKSLNQEMPQKTTSSGYNQITQSRNASETNSSGYNQIMLHFISVYTVKVKKIFRQ